MLQKAGYGIQFLCAMRSLVVAMMTEDSEQFLLALSNGIVSVAGMIGICETHVVIQTLTKALAGYSVKKNFEAYLEARANNDVAGMLVAGLNIAMDLAMIFWPSCFDGDTLVATEAGVKRIDEGRAGGLGWGCHGQTGELALKVVKEVFVRENDELLHIETSRGAIDATTNHPFYVVGKGWVAAGNLAMGDCIHAISGDSGVVTGLELEKLDDRKETVQSMKNRLGEIEKSLAEENLSEDDKLAMKKEQEQLKSEVIALSPEDKLSSLYELKRTLEKRAAEAEGVAVGETPRSMDAFDMEALRMVDDLIGDAKDEVKAGSVKEKELRQTAGKEEAEQDVAKMKEQAKDETKAGTAPIQQQDSASVVFASTKGILLTKEQVAAATRKVQARAETVGASVASR